MQRVISELYETYRGKPALVIGGGPSVPADLAQLTQFRPALVLSANEHGHRQDSFPVDYTVHCDKIHVLKRDERGKHLDMAHYLSQFGKPRISRWATADVRLEDWKFITNSGATAVAVAAVLGCSPIVVTGLDYWATGRVYFHEPSNQKTKTYPPSSTPDRRLSPLRQFVGDAHIRPMSGLLLTAWPKYDPAETFGPPPTLPYVLRTRAAGAADYRAVRSFHWSNYDTVAQGTVIKLTKQEAEPLLRDGKIARTVSPV
jgi:hypothetical protein